MSVSKKRHEDEEMRQSRNMGRYCDRNMGEKRKRMEKIGGSSNDRHAPRRLKKLVFKPMLLLNNKNGNLIFRE